MDDFQIGRLANSSGPTKKFDFSDSDIDGNEFGAALAEQLASDLDVSKDVTSLGSAVKTVASHSIVPRPPIETLKVDFSKEEMHDMFSLVRNAFSRAGV